MRRPLRKFDMGALQAALDAERQARNLSWTELTEEINVPFRGTPSIPISVSTLRSMHAKRSVTSGVVLQVLRWLGRTPESFLNGGESADGAADLFSPGMRVGILRFDTRALHAALNAERVKRGMSWKQVAGELPGFTENMLTNLASGPLIGFPRVMTLTQWLDRPAAAFVRVRDR